MIRPFTIAHISDLHLSAEFRRQNIRRTKQLLDHLARRNIDHLVITGDIAANAQPAEFAMARGLLTSYGFYDATRTTIIPGNHDIFGGVHTAEDILDFPSRCRHTRVQRTVQMFFDSFGELFRGCSLDMERGCFPFVKDLGPVVLVGLNSVAPYSVVGNPFGSNGGVQKSEIHAARRLLSRDASKHKPRIVLIHHHFNKATTSGGGTLSGIWGNLENQTMKLHGKKKLLKFFRDEKIDLVLHGHQHVNLSYVRKGIHFVNAGGSIMGLVPGDPLVNLVHVGGHQITSEFCGIPATRPAERLPMMESQARFAVAS